MSVYLIQSYDRVYTLGIATDEESADRIIERHLNGKGDRGDYFYERIELNTYLL